MRGSRSFQEARPWVIDEIAPDFRLLDVWALPVEGNRDEFASFVLAMTSFDPAAAGSVLSRALFWVRLRMGAMLGWDESKERPIPGRSETTLSARLPEGLRGSAAFISKATHQKGARFTPLYLTADEYAAEISNDTVHGVLQLRWVERTAGRYRAQMGVYVKPRGLLGEIYLKIIQPFRHLIVYPTLVRQIGRSWEARSTAEL
jgi:uncharacterized protein DUF2867